MCFWCFSLFAGAQSEVHDSIRVSVLTCSPGHQVYRLYGHSAIRYQNCTKGVDVVFNYGVFNFNAPYFLWRFVKGETDYRLGMESYRRFREAYVYYQSDIQEQELNFTFEQKKAFIRLLQENYKPENRYYRYNFLYDNCATRIRDKVEAVLGNSLIYNFDAKKRTFRSIIRQYTCNHSWAELGPDFALGSKADVYVAKRQEMFIPGYLFQAFETAKIKQANGSSIPLIKGTRKIVRTKPLLYKDTFFTPFKLSFFICGFLLIIVLLERRYRCCFWGVDLFLFGAAGLAGCVLTFLVLFSEHPAVSPNYLLFVFHPLHLFYLPWLFKRSRKRLKQPYYIINVIVLTLFMLLWGVIPQTFNITVVPLVLCLLLRSISYLFLVKNEI